MELTRYHHGAEARKTYQYLRLGMVGIVALLVVSLAIERSNTDCFQRSISAYYFTPVRTIFVGALMAIAAALIFIAGRTLAEDVALSLAGLFAPVVAIVPTTDVGTCWSTPPPAEPTSGGALAPWVVAGSRNNLKALFIMGLVGLLAVAVIQVVDNRTDLGAIVRRSALSSWVALAVIAIVLAVGWWSYNRWDDFFDHAHGYSAVALFAFLGIAVSLSAWEERDVGGAWSLAYAGIVLAMAGTALVVWRVGGEYAVLWLEGIEVGLFVLYWGLETLHHWNEPLCPDDAPAPAPVA